MPQTSDSTMSNISQLPDLKQPIGTKLSDWVFTLICAFILLFESRPWQILELTHFLLLAVISSSVFFLLWWADRYEREPFVSIMWALAWGAFPACFLSIIFQSLAFSTVSGAFIEELFKLLGLWLAFRRANIQSWMDGLILGGYIGLGFAVFEDILYAISDINATAVIVDRGIFSIFSHTFFSGIGSVIIVFGLLTKRFWLQIIGFTVAFTLHLLWNTVLALELFTYTTSSFIFIYAVIPPVVVITSAIMLRLHEKKLLEFKGNIAVRNGLITEETFKLIKSLSLRRDHLRKLSTPADRAQFKQGIHAICRQILS